MSTLIKLTKTGKVNCELRRRLPAGLGSSVVGIFINSAVATARLRAVVGGHTMALLLESVCSFILFARSIEGFIARPQSISRPDDGLRRRIVDTGHGNHRHRAPARRWHCHRDGQPGVDARGIWRHSRSDQAGAAAASARPTVSVPIASPNL